MSSKMNVVAEDALAAKVELERERAGMSPADLAAWMTKAGCPMNQSAIWKIENGEPRRRITFNEAVTFAKVFGLTLEELALPHEVVTSQRVQDIISGIREDRALRVELDDRWGSGVEEIGRALEEDSTGMVASTVNRSIVPGPESQFVVQQPEAGIQVWGLLDDDGRGAVAEYWMDASVEFGELVPVEVFRIRSLRAFWRKQGVDPATEPKAWTLRERY